MIVNPYALVLFDPPGHPQQNNAFNRAAEGACWFPIRVLRKGEILMTTYEEMQILLTFVLVVIAILNLKNK